MLPFHLTQYGSVAPSNRPHSTAWGGWYLATASPQTLWMNTWNSPLPLTTTTTDSVDEHREQSFTSHHHHHRLCGWIPGTVLYLSPPPQTLWMNTWNSPLPLTTTTTDSVDEYLEQSFTSHHHHRLCGWIPGTALYLSPPPQTLWMNTWNSPLPLTTTTDSVDEYLEQSFTSHHHHRLCGWTPGTVLYLSPPPPQTLWMNTGNSPLPLTTTTDSVDEHREQSFTSHHHHRLCGWTPGTVLYLSPPPQTLWMNTGNSPLPLTTTTDSVDEHREQSFTSHHHHRLCGWTPGTALYLSPPPPQTLWMNTGNSPLPPTTTTDSVDEYREQSFTSHHHHRLCGWIPGTVLYLSPPPPQTLWMNTWNSPLPLTTTTTDSVDEHREQPFTSHHHHRLCGWIPGTVLYLSPPPQTLWMNTWNSPLPLTTTTDSVDEYLEQSFTSHHHHRLCGWIPGTVLYLSPPPQTLWMNTGNSPLPLTTTTDSVDEYLEQSFTSHHHHHRLCGWIPGTALYLSPPPQTLWMNTWNSPLPLTTTTTDSVDEYLEQSFTSHHHHRLCGWIPGTVLYLSPPPPQTLWMNTWNSPLPLTTTTTDSVDEYLEQSFTSHHHHRLCGWIPGTVLYLSPPPQTLWMNTWNSPLPLTTTTTDSVDEYLEQSFTSHHHHHRLCGWTPGTALYLSPPPPQTLWMNTWNSPLPLTTTTDSVDEYREQSFTSHHHHRLCGWTPGTVLYLSPPPQTLWMNTGNSPLPLTTTTTDSVDEYLEQSFTSHHHHHRLCGWIPGTALYLSPPPQTLWMNTGNSPLPLTTTTDSVDEYREQSFTSHHHHRLCGWTPGTVLYLSPPPPPQTLWMNTGNSPLPLTTTTTDSVDEYREQSFTSHHHHRLCGWIPGTVLYLSPPPPPQTLWMNTWNSPLPLTTTTDSVDEHREQSFTSHHHHRLCGWIPGTVLYLSPPPQTLWMNTGNSPLPLTTTTTDSVDEYLEQPFTSHHHHHRLCGWIPGTVLYLSPPPPQTLWMNTWNSPLPLTTTTDSVDEYREQSFTSHHHHRLCGWIPGTVLYLSPPPQTLWMNTWNSPLPLTTTTTDSVDEYLEQSFTSHHHHRLCGWIPGTVLYLSPPPQTLWMNTGNSPLPLTTTTDSVDEYLEQSFTSHHHHHRLCGWTPGTVLYLSPPPQTLWMNTWNSPLPLTTTTDSVDEYLEQSFTSHHPPQTLWMNTGNSPLPLTTTTTDSVDEYREQSFTSHHHHHRLCGWIPGTVLYLSPPPQTLWMNTWNSPLPLTTTTTDSVDEYLEQSFTSHHHHHRLCGWIPGTALYLSPPPQTLWMNTWNSPLPLTTTTDSVDEHREQSFTSHHHHRLCGWIPGTVLYLSPPTTDSVDEYREQSFTSHHHHHRLCGWIPGTVLYLSPPPPQTLWMNTWNSPLPLTTITTDSVDEYREQSFTSHHHHHRLCGWIPGTVLYLSPPPPQTLWMNTWNSPLPLTTTTDSVDVLYLSPPPPQTLWMNTGNSPLPLTTTTDSVDEHREQSFTSHHHHHRLCGWIPGTVLYLSPPPQTLWMNTGNSPLPLTTTTTDSVDEYREQSFTSHHHHHRLCGWIPGTVLYLSPPPQTLWMNTWNSPLPLTTTTDSVDEYREQSFTSHHHHHRLCGWTPGTVLYLSPPPQTLWMNTGNSPLPLTTTTDSVDEYLEQSFTSHHHHHRLCGWTPGTVLYLSPPPQTLWMNTWNSPLPLTTTTDSVDEYREQSFTSHHHHHRLCGWTPGTVLYLSPPPQTLWMNTWNSPLPLTTTTDSVDEYREQSFTSHHHHRLCGWTPGTVLYLSPPPQTLWMNTGNSPLPLTTTTDSVDEHREQSFTSHHHHRLCGWTPGTVLYLSPPPQTLWMNTGNSPLPLTTTTTDSVDEYREQSFTSHHHHHRLCGWTPGTVLYLSPPPQTLWMNTWNSPLPLTTTTDSVDEHREQSFTSHHHHRLCGWTPGTVLYLSPPPQTLWMNTGNSPLPLTTTTTDSVDEYLEQSFTSHHHHHRLCGWIPGTVLYLSPPPQTLWMNTGNSPLPLTTTTTDSVDEYREQSFTSHHHHRLCGWIPGTVLYLSPPPQTLWMNTGNSPLPLTTTTTDSVDEYREQSFTSHHHHRLCGWTPGTVLYLSPPPPQTLWMNTWNSPLPLTTTTTDSVDEYREQSFTSHHHHRLCGWTPGTVLYLSPPPQTLWMNTGNSPLPLTTTTDSVDEYREQSFTSHHHHRLCGWTPGTVLYLSPPPPQTLWMNTGNSPLPLTTTTDSVDEHREQSFTSHHHHHRLCGWTPGTVLYLSPPPQTLWMNTWNSPLPLTCGWIPGTVLYLSPPPQTLWMNTGNSPLPLTTTTTDSVDEHREQSFTSHHHHHRLCGWTPGTVLYLSPPPPQTLWMNTGNSPLPLTTTTDSVDEYLEQPFTSHHHHHRLCGWIPGTALYLSPPPQTLWMNTGNSPLPLTTTTTDSVDEHREQSFTSHHHHRLCGWTPGTVLYLSPPPQTLWMNTGNSPLPLTTTTDSVDEHLEQSFTSHHHHHRLCGWIPGTVLYLSPPPQTLWMNTWNSPLPSCHAICS